MKTRLYGRTSTSPTGGSTPSRKTSAVRFIIAESDEFLDNFTNARPAAKELKGPNDIKVIAKASHKLSEAQTAEAAKLAAEWLKARL